MGNTFQRRHWEDRGENCRRRSMPASEPTGEVIDARELARRAGVSSGTITKLVKAHLLFVTYDENNRWLFDLGHEKNRDWLASMQQPTPTQEGSHENV